MTPNPAQIIVDIYDIALILSGLLAFGAIVFGAIKYTLAAGNPSEQHEGREWITQALLGVLLLFGAYLILHTINPGLVNNIDLPALEKIQETNPPGTNINPQPACTLTCVAPKVCKIIAGKFQDCVEEGKISSLPCGWPDPNTHQQGPGYCSLGFVCVATQVTPPNYECVGVSPTTPPRQPPVGQ